MTFPPMTSGGGLRIENFFSVSPSYFCKISVLYGIMDAYVPHNERRRTVSNEKALTDAEIVDLYLARDEDAIRHTARLYGPYCLSVAMNVLNSLPDAEVFRLFRNYSRICSSNRRVCKKVFGCYG